MCLGLLQKPPSSVSFFSESLLNKVMVKQAEQEFLLHSLHILREDAINTPINHIDKSTYIYMNWAI